MPALLGIFLSGSGPAILALAQQNETELALLLVEEFRRHGVEARPLFLQVDNAGASASMSKGKPFVEICLTGRVT